MKLQHLAAIFVSVALPFVLHCGGRSDGSHPSGQVSTPSSHRATPLMCPAVAPMPECPNGGECATDADCTAGPNGRCLSTSPCSCQYNDCATDDDCGAGRDCACQTGGGAGSGGNPPTTCVSSNCRTDADCGPGGYCSPSLTPQSYCGSFLGWFCHTPKDECGIDSDCVLDGAGAPPLSGLCTYSVERGFWICSTGVGCGG
jgi:hypothetical protein